MPAVAAAAWLAAACVARANVVLEWDGLMLAAIRAETVAPTLATRNLAILHTAMFDAVNAVTRSHQAYQFSLPAPAACSVEAAAVGAAYEVMWALFPGQSARTEEMYEAWRAVVPATEASTNGLALGREAGRLTVEARADDGSSTQVPYIPDSAPGAWRRTPPFFRPPVDPHWRYVRPFAIGALEPFLPPPPPRLASAEYADVLNEVKWLGAANSSTRSSEQSTIARFWSDFTYTATPPGHWHEIAALLARQQELSVPATARLFALLSVAQADAAIVCWEAKYRYNFWRPVTAIQRADEDDNPATTADAAWQSFLPAPNFPEHTSGHSTFSKASATVLTWFFGTDRMTFTVGSDALPGAFRTYTSLGACTEEIGRSRIYGGIHFESANRAGKACGKLIAEYVVANYLLPLEQLPQVRWERWGSAALNLRVLGHVGAAFVLESSLDLLAWAPLHTNTVPSGGLALEGLWDPAAPHQFFRVRE